MAEVNPELEVWKSLVLGPRGINRFSEKGERVIERVDGGGTFDITPDERRRNQRLVRDARNDDFTNGTFILLTAVDSDPNSVSLWNQPQALEDDELEAMLDLPYARFLERLEEVNEAVTAERLYMLCRKVDAGTQKLKATTAKLKALNPNAVAIGDHLGAGREDPDEGSDQSKTIDDALESPSGPRQYAGVDT